MNANEMADAICPQFASPIDLEHLKQAANMLRQQQAEIDLLRMTQPNIDYDKELLKPLFVGRELTEEEIVEVINEHGWRGLTGYLLTFAHAILRKAQEK